MLPSSLVLFLTFCMLLHDVRLHCFPPQFPYKIAHHELITNTFQGGRQRCMGMSFFSHEIFLDGMQLGFEGIVTNVIALKE